MATLRPASTSITTRVTGQAKADSLTIASTVIASMALLFALGITITIGALVIVKGWPTIVPYDSSKSVTYSTYAFTDWLRTKVSTALNNAETKYPPVLTVNSDTTDTKSGFIKLPNVSILDDGTNKTRQCSTPAFQLVNIKDAATMKFANDYDFGLNTIADTKGWVFISSKNCDAYMDLSLGLTSTNVTGDFTISIITQVYFFYTSTGATGATGATLQKGQLITRKFKFSGNGDKSLKVSEIITFPATQAGDNAKVATGETGTSVMVSVPSILVIQVGVSGDTSANDTTITIHYDGITSDGKPSTPTTIVDSGLTYLNMYAIRGPSSFFPSLVIKKPSSGN